MSVPWDTSSFVSCIKDIGDISEVLGTKALANAAAQESI